MPSDVIYTHPDALICHNKNGDGGPITYQIIILYIADKSLIFQDLKGEYRINILPMYKLLWNKKVTIHEFYTLI